VHDLARAQRAELELVAGGYRLAHGDAGVSRSDHVARLERVDGDRDVIRRTDADRARESGRG
jgi:hypothetical protein